MGLGRALSLKKKAKRVHKPARDAKAARNSPLFAGIRSVAKSEPKPTAPSKSASAPAAPSSAAAGSSTDEKKDETADSEKKDDTAAPASAASAASASAPQQPKLSAKQSTTKELFDKRQLAKAKTADMKALQHRMIETVKEKKRLRTKRRLERAKRAAENDVKNGTFQVIKDPAKVNKWSKKARRYLVKMSGEQIAKISQSRGARK